MKIGTIQQTMSNCCSQFTNHASAASAALGRGVHVLALNTAEGAKIIYATVRITAAKTAEVGTAAIHQTATYTGAAIQGALQHGKQFTKEALTTAKSVSQWSFKTATSVGKTASAALNCAITQSASHLQTVRSGMKTISGQIASATASTMQKTSGIFKDVMGAAKEGFKVSRSFMATHQKETAIASGALAVALAAGFAAHRIFHQEPSAT